MIYRKTPAKERETYTYRSVTGETFTYRPEDVGEETIHLLHNMDDSFVNNNLKNAKVQGSKTWNVSLDEMLEENRDASIADPMEAPWESGDPLKERLYEAVQELPEDQQELFAMRYLWEMTQQEISRRTGIPRVTICKHLMRTHRSYTQIPPSGTSLHTAHLLTRRTGCAWAKVIL